MVCRTGWDAIVSASASYFRGCCYAAESRHGRILSGA